MLSIYTPYRISRLKKHKVFLMGEHYRRAQEVLDEAVAFSETVNGTIYTGIHHENDWSTVRWWDRGVHQVNRTGDYAVVW
jgi:hypothetical protein